nr:MAG TPA: hypothetical protein [Caudoviricetes sp.]
MRGPLQHWTNPPKNRCVPFHCFSTCFQVSECTTLET